MQAKPLPFTLALARRARRRSSRPLRLRIQPPQGGDGRGGLEPADDGDALARRGLEGQGGLRTCVCVLWNKRLVR